MSETLDGQSRIALVKYKLDRANETFQRAELLAKEGFFNATVNRLNYAFLYAALSLLVRNGITTASHAGVNTIFGLHFFSKGLLALENGKTFCRLFEIRYSGDYDDFVFCDIEMINEYIPQAKAFVKALVD